MSCLLLAHPMDWSWTSGLVEFPEDVPGQEASPSSCLIVKVSQIQSVKTSTQFVLFLNHKNLFKVLICLFNYGVNVEHIYNIL